MRRRDLLRGLVVVAAISVAPSAHADPMDDVTRQLRAQGFEVREVSRTWLGRIRVVAESDSLQREIVFDRTTGEIRRDLVTQKRTPSAGRSDDGDGRSGSRSASGGDGRSGGGGGNSGGGNAGRDDDDDDDRSGPDGGDDDRDDDDDRSGRGGGDDDRDDDDDRSGRGGGDDDRGNDDDRSGHGGGDDDNDDDDDDDDD